MNNIILIGMPGCGKSTVGVVLAKIIGYKFTDTDLLIQETTGKLLQEIIDKDGNEVFLKTEADVIETINCNNHIIATGGSAVLSKRAVDKLKSLGTLVYLKQPYDEICKRVSNLSTRGVAMGGSQTLKELFDYRMPIYESVADVVIEAQGLSIEETAKLIVDTVSTKKQP